jgi:deazaflavin-dependent oxidoreductase (nitroreductase family)
MSERPPIRPGEPGWQQDHVRRYQASKGADGHIWNGIPTLLLTTTGRKSGKPYTTPLIYGKDGDRYLIVGSWGGSPRHPQWYLNLVAQPQVEIQVAAEKFKARTSTAAGEEKARLWKIMAAIYPNYDVFQTRTTRVIPLVVIERA